MYDRARLLLGQQLIQIRPIADITVSETIRLVRLYSDQVLQVAGIRQLVEIDDRGAHPIEPIQDEVRSDKAGTAGYKNWRRIV
jgi:hypothetical protein